MLPTKEAAQEYTLSIRRILIFIQHDHAVTLRLLLAHRRVLLREARCHRHLLTKGDDLLLCLGALEFLDQWHVLHAQILDIDVLLQVLGILALRPRRLFQVVNISAEIPCELGDIIRIFQGIVHIGSDLEQGFRNGAQGLFIR